MSAILNVLRGTIAGMAGNLLVTVDAIVALVDAVPARAYPIREVARVARPIRAFRHHPPQAWAAP